MLAGSIFLRLNVNASLCHIFAVDMGNSFGVTSDQLKKKTIVADGECCYTVGSGTDGF